MTIAEILEQAKALSLQERKELMQLLGDTFGNDTTSSAKTGAEIVKMIEALDEPIEFVDEHIEDPVEWVKAQRRKHQDRLKPYWDGEV